MPSIPAGPSDRDSAFLSLDELAAISAAIAEGDRPLLEVLAAHRVTEQEWQDVTSAWSYRLAEDEAAADVYAVAFVRAQDQLKPIPAMAPEAWAILVAELASEGRSALARRGLSAADYLRLQRHWARALGADRALAAHYAQGFYAAQRPTKAT